MLKAIKEFKRPTNKTELRAFLGLANQLASFIPDLAHCTTNFRKMTSTKMVFTWQDPHEADFILTKKLLTSPLVVKPFYTAAHTILLTDTSRLHGLGFALMQKPDDSDKMSLIICGSKSLRDTQAHYATVELEARLTSPTASSGKQRSHFFVTKPSGNCIMKFNRSIQGSKNASSIFTRTMEVIFAGQHLQDLDLIF